MASFYKKKKPAVLQRERPFATLYLFHAPNSPPPRPKKGENLQKLYETTLKLQFAYIFCVFPLFRVGVGL